jgi:nitrate reductase delta subunit
MVVTTQTTAEQRALGLLAGALEYPIESPLEYARECADLLAAESPEAATELREFLSETTDVSHGRLQEIFTATFDLDATRHPYVGYHLFGESYMRSAFLTELKERYRAYEYETSETELPDRLSSVLRFLSICDDSEMRQELINDALLPVMGKMLKDGPDINDEADVSNALFPVLSNGGESDDPDRALRAEMMEAGFLPTLGSSPDDEEQEGIESGLPEGIDPYRHLLQGLRLVLEHLATGEQTSEA